MIPKSIYELLPILYVAGGIAAMTAVDSFMSYISGFLMGATGIMVLVMRRNYRTTKQSLMKQDQIIT